MLLKGAGESSSGVGTRAGRGYNTHMQPSLFFAGLHLTAENFALSEQQTILR
jgi:hypothetical protein